MRTDPALIARLGAEIDARFRGARVTDVGLVADGRLALALWARGSARLLCIDIFGTPPLVTAEDEELPIVSEPGFVRAAGAALRGTSLLSAKARKGDRVLRLTFGTRSRFGVSDEIDLYLELVPRFGNAIVVKRDMVVAAAKEFSLAENGTRSVLAGQPYELPPLLARERAPDESVPEEASVLDAFTTFRNERVGAGERRRTVDRRRLLTKRLDENERKLRNELAKMEAMRRKAEGREELRAQGEAVFATLHELDGEAARDEAKERASKAFAAYKKLGNSLPHVEERERHLHASLAAVEALRWEAERAEDGDLADVEHAVGQLDARPGKSAPPPAGKKRKRAPMEFRTEHGSRILVGRSPSENADLTFRVARPHDLWFHAQNIPGAHVILQRDDRQEPPEDDVRRAAALAAFYSKGKASGSVAIDYTQRKYVRAQRNAPPGLVWYTNPRTILAEPSAS